MKTKEDFTEYINVFLTQNAKLNLISKNDEKYLWEKHIFDSLAIEKFFKKHNVGSAVQLLDIGTGGGFPSVPIALCYLEIEVYALDSIRKKINAIENIKTELNIKNLHPFCGRAENLIKQPLLLKNLSAKQDCEILRQPVILSECEESHNYCSLRMTKKMPQCKGGIFDIITSRAVAALDKITEYAIPLLKKDGYFIAYKSVRAQEEISKAKNTLKKYKAEVIDVIEYDLPLDENHTRNLIIIKQI